jgi:LPS sulfotransferase NodH
MLRAGTTSNGVFGIKIMTGTAYRLSGRPAAGCSGLTRQHADMLARSVLVHVRRCDKVAATFSHWRAQNTGEWLRFDNGTAAPLPPLEAPPDEWVSEYHRSLHWSDRFWEAAGQRSGSYLELWYEEFSANLDQAVNRIAAALGVGIVPALPSHALPRKIHDPRISSMIEAWTDRTGGCPDCTSARPDLLVRGGALSP